MRQQHEYVLYVNPTRLTQAVDENRGHVPPSSLWGGSAIDKPIVSTYLPHPWARGQSGDRWQISVTAAKVTLQDGL